MTAPRSVTDALVGVLLGPGIVAHEYGHVLACRLFGVEVVAGNYRSPFGAVYVDHEQVESFGADLAIAVAPLLANTTLGLAAFSLGQVASSVPGTLLWYWLGACFALTALPSGGDTATLFRTASGLPTAARPLGYLVAAPLRAITVVNDYGGVVTAAWLLGLFGLSGYVAALP